MYKVVKFFTDLQDNKHPYNVGDIFPREGVEVSEDRLKELSTDNNKRGMVLIEEVPAEKPVKASTKNAEEEVPKEAPGEPQEEPLKEEAGVDSPKKPKAKRTPKKA